MTLQRQAGIWLGGLIVLIGVLWLLQEILLPFIAGFVLAYFLDPVADRLERLGLPRIAATLVILSVAVAAVVVGVLIIVPVVADQAIKLANDLPNLIKLLVARLDEVVPQAVKDMFVNAGGSSSGSIGDIVGKASGWAATFLQSVWSGGMALVNLLSLMIITPIVAFYLLLDWDRLVAKVDSWLPRDHLEEIRGIARDIDGAMAGFIRGQGTVCLLLGMFYAAGLSIAGLNFGLAIGMVAGLLSFVPYVGALIGGILAIGVGLVQFWPDYTMILIIIAIFVAGQFIEGNFLSPKLVGESIGLHPVWLMFALFAFGYLFGFVGLLLAVPLAAAAGVFVRYGLSKYLKSKLYRGIPPPALVEVKPQTQTPAKKRRKG
jgi:predicted PurR-regulated permease PerM